MWANHVQSLKLLPLPVKGEMHLQENSLFLILYFMKCCPIPSTSCNLFGYKV